MNLEKLAEHFPPEDIKQREGRGGKTLDYVEVHRVIQRLNEAFEGKWSFEVKDKDRTDKEVIVRGSLSAEGITKEQFGSSDIVFSRDKKEPVCIGDDYKAAASDALKKCAAMFGVALHLYENKSATQKQSSKPKGASNKNGKIAEQQKNAIVKLLGQIGVSEDQIAPLIKERYGVTLDELSYEERANIIKKLSAEANEKKAA